MERNKEQESLKQEAEKITEQLQTFYTNFKKLEEKTDRYRLDGQDLYTFKMLYHFADLSWDLAKIFEDYNKPIKMEGVLQKKQNERYSLDTFPMFDLSSGQKFEVWMVDSDFMEGGYWLPTVMEHRNGSYYAKFVGNELEGLLVRIK